MVIYDLLGPFFVDDLKESSDAPVYFYHKVEMDNAQPRDRYWQQGL